MKNILIAFTILLFTACSSDDNNNNTTDYRTQNEEEIVAYIAANNIDAQKSSTGLYYVIDQPGIGDNPIQTDRVKVSYKGYYTNGSVFDESDEFPWNSLVVRCLFVTMILNVGYGDDAADIYNNQGNDS